MRKRWTPKTEVTDSLLKFREKRKWQIALRRYVLEKQPCSFYAPYFALDIETFRKWIEAQFTEDLNWDNFSTSWQLDHIVPVAYFDFSHEQDLRLCWNFTNIRIEKTNTEKERTHRLDVLTAKAWFQSLFEQTGLSICQDMVAKIQQVEEDQLSLHQPLPAFILQHQDRIKAIEDFGVYEMNSLNSGTDIREIIAEQELLKKFGQSSND